MLNAIKDAPTNVLCDAARTLQAAHDFVEINQFSMNYGAEKGATYCCFIGSVRQAAAEHWIDPEGPSESPASDLALQALDGAARVRGYSGEPFRDEPGGVAEATIVRNDDGSPKRDGQLSKPVALETYRQALREMHTELMSREDAPVPA